MCTTSIDCGPPILRSSETLPRVWMARRGSTIERIWRETFRICRCGSSGARTEQGRCVERSYRKTVGNARWGVPVLEDKVVQRAVVEALNAIYEEDFLGFSYGFRPKRSPHQALDALTVGVERRKVNWVLDADLRSFFDTLKHAWLVQFIEHRVADKRIVRLIQKWLSAGVLEDGKRIQREVGTVQGESISPLLANIYLHYGAADNGCFSCW